MEEKEVILTQEGFDKLEQELNYLKTEKRSEIADRIKVALGFGDLSENSEYDEAKTAQAENEGKIVELENKIRHAKIIDEKEFELLKDQPIAKMIYQNKNTKYLKMIEDEFKEDICKRVAVSYSSNRYMEFNALNVNKGNALSWLAKYLEIEIEDTIAIGDNYNDLEMIKRANLGACVSSANDDIKAVANYVTKLDYYQGAVKEVIEKFILEEN